MATGKIMFYPRVIDKLALTETINKHITTIGK